MKQDKDKLLEIQQEFIQLFKALMKAAGGNRIDGAYDKIFCKILDPEFPLRLLPPYASVNEVDFAQYRDFLIKESPKWMESK